MTDERRDRILLHGTFAEQRAMFVEAAGFEPLDDEVILRAVHKAITAIPYMPEERKKQSREWLAAHRSEAWF